MEKVSKAAFYISYYQAGQKLKDKNERLAFYDTILAYIFDGVEPGELPFTVDLLFTTVRPFIDADIKRKRGGAPIGNNNAEKQPKNNIQNNVKNNLKTNNVNENDNVNVKDKENDNVNVNDNGTDIHSSFLNLTDLNSFFIEEAGYNFSNKVLNLIIEKGQEFEDPKKAFLQRLNYINSKYKDKSTDEKQGLFFSSLSWDITDEEEEQKEKKSKKTNLEYYKTAPKVCTKCGAKVIKWAGVPNAVICKSCGTYWEYDKEGGSNVWKCSRE